jgi:hypothetical protein
MSVSAPGDAAETVPSSVRREPPRIALVIVVSLLVGLVVAAGCLTVLESGGLERRVVPASPAPVAARPAGDPFRTGVANLGGPPTRLRVRAIGVDTALEALRLGADGELRPPADDDKAGWYADGTAPGDLGPAVLAGHVDSSRGPAVFYRLRDLRAGDTIEVVRDGRTLRFTVTATAWYPKRAFPTDRVYGPTPDRQLRLITCGGVFDRRLRSYRDNLVVYAVAG